MSVAYKASGTFTSGTGSVTPPYPTGGSAPAADDIAILVVTSENQSISLTTANGFVEVGAQANKAAGTAATDPGVRMAVYWKRCVGSDSDPVVADSGNHTDAQIHLFSGCVTSGNPWDVYAEGNDSGANDTSGSIPGATTTFAPTLVVLLEASSRNTTSTTNFSAWTNSNLTSLTERADNTNTAGLGGGHGMATGEWAQAGAYGNTTVTHAATTYHGSMSIALKPAQVASEEIEDFESGTDGNSYTTSSGIADGGSGTGTATYQDTAAAEGTLGVELVSNGSTLLARNISIADGTNLEQYAFVALRGSAPSSSMTIGQIKDVLGNPLVVLRLNTDGTIGLRDNATTRATSTATIDTTTWLQIGWGFNGSSVVMTLYDTDGSVLETEQTGTYSGTNAPTSLSWGIISAPGAALTLEMDYVGYNTTQYITPLTIASPTTYEVTGTSAATSGAQGNADRVPIVYEATGTVAVTADTSGNVAAAKVVSGTIPVVSTASGDATRVAITYQASGTSAATSAASGDATGLIQASGTSPATSTSSGNADRVGQTFAASGTSAATVATSGDATGRIGVTGTIPVVAATSGDATIAPRTYDASGTVTAVTAASGDATRQLQIREATGTVAAVAATSGDVTKAPRTWDVSGTVAGVAGSQGNAVRVFFVSGTVAGVAGSSGGGAGIINVSGTTAGTAASSGNVTKALKEASGTVAATSGVSGDAVRYAKMSGTVAATSGGSGNGTGLIQASGTSAATAGGQGAVTGKLQATAAAVAAVTTASGDVTRIAANFEASGTVAATSGASGYTGMTSPASGTIPAVVTVEGNATRVGIMYQVSGTSAAQAAVTGNAERVLVTQQASGTVAAVTAVSGAATRVTLTLAASGTVAAVAELIGDAVRAGVTYQASGTVPVSSASSGSASKVFVSSGETGLLVPLSEERDRDLTRR